MPKIFRIVFRKPGQKTKRSITVNLDAKRAKKILKFFKGLSSSDRVIRGLPSNAIFSIKQVKRIKRK